MSDEKKPENIDKAHVWWEDRLKELNEKYELAKAKLDKAKEDLDKWAAMKDFEKEKKSKAKIKSILKRPHNRYLQLQLVGEDLKNAFSEGLRRKRIKKIIREYSKKLEKLKDSLKDCDDAIGTYPELVDLCGGFDISRPMSDLFQKDDNSHIHLVVAAGVEAIEFEIIDDDAE
jgi:hypothetical protein